MPLHINRRNKGVLGRILRVEGGGVVVDLASDVQPEEISAMMVSISDFCKAQGWNPGLLAKGVSDIEMARRGLVPSARN
jgi:hypothetical protein